MQTIIDLIKDRQEVFVKLLRKGGSMKKALSFVPVMFFLFIVPIDAQNQAYNPEVPRISVFEAYTKYKAGRAILIHAGGEVFERRHIVGAFNVDAPAVLNKGRPLPNFPMRGIEIIIYCY